MGRGYHHPRRGGCQDAGESGVGGGGKLPPVPSTAANQDDPGWSREEKAIADYLRANTAYTVDPGGPTPQGRDYDFTLNILTNAIPAEGKNPGASADAHTMLNRAKKSLERGGQAPCLIFDLRQTDMTIADARAGANSIAATYGVNGKWPGKLNYLVVIGNGFYFEEAI